MHAPRAALRSSCNACNAYDPARALHRALSSSARLGSLSAAELSTAPAASARRRSKLARALPVAARRLTSSHGAAPNTGVGAGEQHGGRMANYLSLQDHFERPQTSDDRPVRTGRTIHPPASIEHVQDYPEAKQTDRETELTARKTKKTARKTQQTARKTQQTDRDVQMATSDSDWVRQIKELAILAGELSQAGPLDNLDQATLEEARAAMNYEPMVIEHRQSPLTDPLPAPWAVAPIDAEADGDAIAADDMLSREIALFDSYWTPSAPEFGARRQVADIIHRRILRWTEVHARTSGSSKSGLCTPLSDIDFIIPPMPGESVKSPDLLGRFESLFRDLRRSSSLILATLRTDHFPIINVQHRGTGLDVQIVIGPPTQRQTQVVRKYQEVCPTFRSIYKVLHAALSMRGLIDVFNGGTGSYGLATMLAASIGRRSNPAPQSAAEQLLRFLDFWAELDTTRFGVRRANERTYALDFGRGAEPMARFKLYLKHDAGERALYSSYTRAAFRRNAVGRAGVYAIGQRRPLQPYLLSLQDPVSAVNDLGRKSNAIKHIQATFDALRTRLRADLAAGSAAVRARGPRENTMLAALVGPCHEVYAARRQRVDTFGRQRQNELSKSGRLKKASSSDHGDHPAPDALVLSPQAEAHQDMGEAHTQLPDSGAELAAASESESTELPASADALAGVAEIADTASEASSGPSDDPNAGKESPAESDGPNGAAESPSGAADRSHDEGRRREAAS